MNNTKEKKSQKLDVLNHMKRHKKKGITSMEAFELYGITRLSAKIFELKHDGYVIECVHETSTNRYGHLCRFGRYVLISEPAKKN